MMNKVELPKLIFFSFDKNKRYSNQRYGIVVMCFAVILEEDERELEPYYWRRFYVN